MGKARYVEKISAKWINIKKIRILRKIFSLFLEMSFLKLDDFLEDFFFPPVWPQGVSGILPSEFEALRSILCIKAEKSIMISSDHKMCDSAVTIGLSCLAEILDV